MTERLPADDAGLARAISLLAAGGLVAFPTDTVYGIGCLATHGAALARIFQAKRRPPDKLVPILVASLEQAEAAGFQADERSRALATAFWPGALTMVLPADEPGADRPATQAFRVPDHPVALALIERSGPLATTSANRSGEPDTYDADDVLVAFADSPELDAVVDGGRLAGGPPSTIVDLSAVRARVLRDGPISRERLAEVIGPVD